MHLHYQILLPLFSLFLVRVDLTDLYPMKLNVKLIQVYDGDTLQVMSGMGELRVRLSKIDAPEKKQPFHGGRGDAGASSKECLEKVLHTKKSLILKVEGLDIYHRVLGDISNINFLLIKEGCAGLYPHTKFNSAKEKQKFLREYFKAKKFKRGLWANGGYQSPKEWRKVSKRNGRRPWHRLSHYQRPYQLGHRRERKAN